jgi:hypothetical protein
MAKSAEVFFPLVPRSAACAPFRNTRTTDLPIMAGSAEFLFPLVPRSAACALLRNTRTTDSPIVARSAEFLFPLMPRLAACALLKKSLGRELKMPFAIVLFRTFLRPPRRGRP